MSSLGFQLVYDLLAGSDGLICERFFLASRGEPLRSLESQRPLHHFPILFISISFEHDYPHLVQMLMDGGVEPFAAKRDERISSASPLIVCGGVATFMNPEPLAPFIDLFVVGEAEPVLAELTEKIVTGFETQSRNELLLNLSRSFTGSYAPVFYNPEYNGEGQLAGYQVAHGLPERIARISVMNSSTAAHSKVTTPHAEFSGMHLTELGRGCSRGCRFCAAGFIYRPPRLWDGGAIVKGLQQRQEDVAKVGLLGMEMADTASLERISEYLQKSGCALSFSSLRADRLNTPLLELLATSELKTVAIAPDGASERLRRVINKGLSERDLLDAAEKLTEAGIFKLKLYLMIGLPTETDEDLQEAVRLIEKIKLRIDLIGRKRGRLTEITVSINCFAPKPWTPFQYHPFGMSDRLKAGEQGEAGAIIAELKRRQKYIKKGLAGLANIHLQFDKPDKVMFQAVLARGDRRLAPVLAEMAGTGIGWKQAMKSNDLTAERFAICGYDNSSFFPWYILDHGIDPEYLWLEYGRGFDEKLTDACDTRLCRRCGVCHD